MFRLIANSVNDIPTADLPYWLGGAILAVIAFGVMFGSRSN